MKTAWLFLSGISLIGLVNLVAQLITKGSNFFPPTLPIIYSLVSDNAGATLPLGTRVNDETDISDEAKAMSEIDETSKQLTFSHTTLGVTLFDFDGNGPSWYTVNDVVMGGVSTSSANIDPETERLSFSGNLSLENNGGFASIRSQEGTYDLSAYYGIALRVRGDGKIYRFRIRTEETGPEIAYTALFKTKNDSWQEIYIPFSEMVPIYRGVVVNGVEALNPASIRSFGLMLSEQQQGEFSLEIDLICAIGNNNVLEEVNTEVG